MFTSKQILFLASILMLMSCVLSETSSAASECGENTTASPFESDSTGDKNEPEKSSLVTLVDGSILIEPVLEFELPELLPYFEDKNLREDYSYTVLYRALFKCANDQKYKSGTIFDYADISYAITRFLTEIGYQKKFIKQSKLINLRKLIERKCEEFASGNHPLSKELLKQKESEELLRQETSRAYSVIIEKK
jgi:hypothetical protein